MHSHLTEVIAAVFFALSIIHTFLTGPIHHASGRFSQGSLARRMLRLLGEVELVFGFWAGLLLAVMTFSEGFGFMTRYLGHLSFSEPLFVFAIMCVASTRPVISAARYLIFLPSAFVRARARGAAESSVYFSCLVLGPLLGSLITEPAAMTVTALILKSRYLEGHRVSLRFMYITLAVLLVNISIGGALTPFAAPPVILVAGKWGWGLGFMLENFGWKVALAVALNAALGVGLLHRELKGLVPLKAALSEETKESVAIPFGWTALHLGLLIAVVAAAHTPVILVAVFAVFLMTYFLSRPYQDRLQLHSSAFVAVFLAGLVILGGLQSWWLEPLLAGFRPLGLFLTATGLTAITDNAALAYLGSGVIGNDPALRYALIAGAVAGGGLTVIANAPNPAGFTILEGCFGEDGIAPVPLFIAATVPTLIAMACLWFL